jgi:hypothetical protein
MKKYIPYIAIPLIIYLVIGFIKMQFNPVYIPEAERGLIVFYSIAGIVIYRLSKLDKNKQS